MAKIIKIEGKKIKAYILGQNTDMEKKMIKEGKIKKIEDGYEIFSQEVKGNKGEKAKIGDYFKVDNDHYPYPNEKEWFEKNHRCIGNDLYEQVPKELDSWEYGQTITEEIKFLLDNQKLKINENLPEKFFEAFLWGSLLHAAKDSVVVLYSVDRNEEGSITSIDFNFITRKEFEKTYKYC